MRQVRRNCFETNSSSMHSLVISNVIDGIYTPEEAQKELWIKREGVLDYSEEDLYFGRYPFRILSQFEEKLKYAYATLDKDVVDKVLFDFIPKVKEVKLPEFLGTDDYCLKGWLEKYNISLKEFLIHKDIYIIQDGDEYCQWSIIKSSGIINKDAIKEELQ